MTDAANRHTLVTFLGKSRDNTRTGYRETLYRFPDGHERRTPFFGLELANQLQPDGVVILGTSGSQWGVLVENLAAAGEDEEQRIALFDAETRADVDQGLLDALSRLMTRAAGYPVVPRLIPYGRDAAEQNEILRLIAEVVPEGAVSFDLTHGFRHLGMIGFLSAFMLERIGRMQVRGLWYGALDMTESGITPVVRLDGLSAVQRWIDALDRFDATGDYGVFADLLVQDGIAPDKAACLRAAAFHERTFNLTDAARKLRTFLPELDLPLCGASALFGAKLKERLAWVTQSGPAEHQRLLSHVYLERRDFVRAAVFAWEAIISAECAAHKLRPDDYGEDGDREHAEAELKARLGRSKGGWRGSPQCRLKNLRNALAHGSPPQMEEIKRALRDATRLYDMIDRDLKDAFR